MHFLARPAFSLPLLRAASAAALPALLSLALEAQEPAPSAFTPAETSALILQWVETEKAISAEKAEWIGQRSEFRQFVDLYAQEIAHLKELVEAAGQHALESEQRRTELIQERDDLQNTRNLLATHLAPLEAKLLRLLPAFPSPLLTEISSAAARLQKASPDRTNQDRVRDLLAILVEADKFQQGVHVDREIRELEGGVRVEVAVLYLGLGAAFYVDESGRRAGTGKPTLRGWTWQTDPSVAAPLKQAIAIIEETQQEARFLPFPLRIETLSAPESADPSP
ncbi:MAG TPA: DUF3450 family protein [Verrucomicrobiales bacterium]|nr:DUF3450 family protein [Verrucomicrobiales bacterium]